MTDLNEIVCIANKYADDINLATNGKARIERGEFTFTEFQSKVVELCKNIYTNVCIFDASCVKPEDVLKAIRDLKLHLPKDVRIIVLYPNLTDEITLQQIHVYGIYDVVRPEINIEEMSDIEIANKIVTDVKWALSEPTDFSKVVDTLSVEIITQQVTSKIVEEPETDGKKKNKKTDAVSALKKPRLMCLYNEDAKKFELFENDGKYNIVDILKADTNVLASKDLSAIDFIILDNVDIETVAYLQSLVEVNENPAVVVAGYDNFDKHAEASRIRGVNAFLYDGTENGFKRTAVRSLTQKIKKEEKSVSKIYAVFGVKGGVGSTTMTAILAQNYAKQHPSERVAVVDYSTKAGDIGALFGIAEPVNNIYQYIQSMCKAKAEHLDLNLLRDKINNYFNYDKKNKLFILPTTFTDIFSYTNRQIATSDIAAAYEYTLDCLRKNFDAIFVDVSKYAGFTYDLAISSADKIVLVSDAKLASTYHLLTKYTEIVGDNYFGQKNNVTVLVNKADIKHSENEYDNYKVIEEKVGKDAIVVIPVDKTLLREEKEMTVNYGRHVGKALPKVWATINRQGE